VERVTTESYRLAILLIEGEPPFAVGGELRTTPGGAKACAAVAPGSIIEAERKSCGPWLRTYETLIAKSGAII
jgi:hypothetical protein